MTASNMCPNFGGFGCSPGMHTVAPKATSDSTVDDCQDFCFVILAIGLALTKAQAKNLNIAMAITLVTQ